jgi:hypothetical protein
MRQILALLALAVGGCTAIDDFGSYYVSPPGADLAAAVDDAGMADGSIPDSGTPTDLPSWCGQPDMICCPFAAGPPCYCPGPTMGVGSCSCALIEDFDLGRGVGVCLRTQPQP